MDFWAVFLDCIVDSSIMLPLIFLTYVVIEIIERKSKFYKDGKWLGGLKGAVLGSVVGAFPECGMSVMSAKLFDKGVIGIGTLFAVFISTSDEAFSILIASNRRLSLIPLILLKIVLGIIFGVILNLIFKSKIKYKAESFSHDDICAHCHDHHTDDEGKNANIKRYVLLPLLHAFQTFLYVFAVMLLFGIFFNENGLVGEDKLQEFLSLTDVYAPFLTALIGLIPSCASSAVITSAYVSGGISFGAMLSGLISNAGVGLAVLFRDTKKIKRNVIILLSLYLIGAISGLVVSLIFSATNLGGIF